MKVLAPKPAKGSFNKDRRISDLVKSQLSHMHEAERKLPPHHQTGQKIESIKTEGQASEYIRQITERLHGKYVVKVPKPPRSAFNKRRQMSDLLKSQVEHFNHVEMTWPPEKRSGTDIAKVTTEHGAAAYIGKITAMMHGTGGEKMTPVREALAASPKRAVKAKKKLTKK